MKNILSLLPLLLTVATATAAEYGAQRARRSLLFWRGHDYLIDVTRSPAWSQWTPRGRIGMVMPMPAKSPITVDIDFIKLEKKSRSN
jgi:hypothetical protein